MQLLLRKLFRFIGHNRPLTFLQTPVTFRNEYFPVDSRQTAEGFISLEKYFKEKTRSNETKNGYTSEKFLKTIEGKLFPAEIYNS